MDPDWRPRGGLRYPEYLRVGELLKLQQPVSRPPHHDETLFIVVHQVFELWFKLTLHELDDIARRLEARDIRGVLKSARRAGEILRGLVEQLRILETMSALDFLEFRSDLEGASGFQSAQFRELEAVLGLRDEDRVPVAVEGISGLGEAYRALLTPDERKRIEARLAEPSLEDRYLDAVVSLVPAPPGEERVHLVDLEDVSADATAAAAVLKELEPQAAVVGDAAAALTRGLESLPCWKDLAATECHAATAALRCGRVLATLGPRLASESAERVDLRLLDEEAVKRRTVSGTAVEAALERAGIAGEVRARATTRLVRRARLRAVFDRARHQSGPGDTWDLWILGEALLELAAALSLYRFRHVQMVERMIGKRRGTGGSPGAAYLEKTVRYRAFPELWRMRTNL